MSEAAYEINKKASSELIKCESCGGNLVFDPESQCLVCEHCGTRVNFEKDKEVRELALSQAFSSAAKWEETSVLRCQNCGASIVIDTDEVATECPYCGASHIRKTEELAGLKPNAVYPFMVTETAAEKFAKKWARRRLFAPSKFKKNIEAKNLKGIYQPCFTFDSNTFSTYSGRIGKQRTRTVHTKNGTKTVTYIEWRYVSGTISIFYDDITFSASEGLDQKRMQKLMPFKKDTLAVYEKKYLSGFLARHYDKDINDLWSQAKNLMDLKIRQAILNRYNCDVVDRLNVSTVHNDVTYKYVLLPVYVLNYRYSKKTYEVNVNGNTGKVAGKTPISFLRSLFAAVIGAAVIVGLYFLFFR